MDSAYPPSGGWERLLPHEKTCRCTDCRHERFNPGPPSMTKRQMRNRAHAEALIENEERGRAKEAA